MTVSIDIALYGLSELTRDQQTDIVWILKERWGVDDVRINTIGEVVFDLVASHDYTRDNDINKGNIVAKLDKMQVLVIGPNGVPLHVLNALRSAALELSSGFIPFEVFSMVENYKHEFVRFNHINFGQR